MSLKVVYGNTRKLKKTTCCLEYFLLKEKSGYGIAIRRHLPARGQEYARYCALSDNFEEARTFLELLSQNAVLPACLSDLAEDWLHDHGRAFESGSFHIDIF